MATHSSILAWRVPMDRGAWWATVHTVAQNWTGPKQLSPVPGRSTSIVSISTSQFIPPPFFLQSSPGSQPHVFIYILSMAFPLQLSSFYGLLLLLLLSRFSRVRLLATTWTAAYQAPLSMEFSRQEYWSGVPLPSPTIWPKKP